MQFLQFRLDPENQCLWRRGESAEDERVLLTPKAYAVLDYLLKHAGRLVTQDELLDAVWARSYVQPEVLKHHVLEIRKALEVVIDPELHRSIVELDMIRRIDVGADGAVSVTVSRFCDVMGGVSTLTGSTLGPAGMGPKNLVSRVFSCFGSKSPAMAMDALLGV